MFLERHNEEVRQAGDSFQREVDVFRNLLSLTNKFCMKIRAKIISSKNVTLIRSVSKQTLYVEMTEFNSPFTITGAECITLFMSEHFLEAAVKLMNYPQICRLPKHQPFSLFFDEKKKSICSDFPKMIYNIPYSFYNAGGMVFDGVKVYKGVKF